MNILALDASTSILSVSLQIGKRLFQSSISDGLKHSENLMPLIDSLFKSAGLKPSELDLLAVPAGPGSFTGLRIALSTAKGIASGSGAALVTVPTLDAYSHGYDFFDGPVIPVIDARKKRIYCSIYIKGEKIDNDLDISPEKLLEKLTEYKKILITGPDSYLFTNISEMNNRFFIDKNFTSTASYAILNLGKEKFTKHGADPDGTGPVYIRKSEAELSLYGE